jgi:hypothetical protein
MANQKRLRKLDDEIWNKIPHTDSKYEVSNYGRVRSYCQNVVDGKVLNPSFIGGFKVVSVKYKGHSRHFLVHKLVAEVFIPKSNKKQTVVIHLDWNKTNNHVSNLQWATKIESYKRMHERLQEERKKKGKVVTYSKLKKDEVALIKSMLDRGVKQKLIAKMFCVSEMQITRIKRGENWSEIEPLESKKPSKSEQLV